MSMGLQGRVSGLATICRALAFTLLALGALSFFPGGALAAGEAACGPEDEMRDAALNATEVAPADDYIRCHGGSDHVFVVIQHRKRMAIAVAFREAIAQDTPEGWRDFLRKYPTSGYKDEALSALQRLIFEEYPATALVGEQSDLGRTDDVNVCRSACSRSAQCQGFTFASARQACTLWSSVRFGQVDADAYSGARQAVAVAPNAPPEPSPPRQRITFEEYRDTALSGRALTQVPARDLDVCRDSCAETEACRGFSFIAGREACTLWATVTSRRSASGTASGVRSDAPRVQTEPEPSAGPRFVYKYGVDFRGGDLGPAIRDITLEKCESLCASRTACRAFTFNTRHAACFLKGSIERRMDFEDAVSAAKR